jgi:hypothetical protein
MNKNDKKKWGFGAVWVTVGKREKNMEMGVIRRPAVGGGGAEVPRWCGGGDGSDGW